MNTPKASARSARRTASRRRSATSTVTGGPATADKHHTASSDDPDAAQMAEPASEELAQLDPDDVFAAFVDEVPATGGAARAEYLPNRGYAVVRQVFVQHRQNPQHPVERPSTLGTMVRSRDFRAILLYLLVLAAEPLMTSNRRLPLRTIANMLTTATNPCTVRQARHAIAALQRHKLVRVVEHGMTVELFPLLEDGSGEEWTQPIGEDDALDLIHYMSVPHELFTDEVLDQLHLPGLAVLLVALKETSTKPVFTVPVERFQEWYGFSERTAERGYSELVDAGLVRVHRQLVRDSRMPRGVKARFHRTLLSAFSTQSRKEAQARAQVRAQAAQRPAATPASAS